MKFIDIINSGMLLNITFICENTRVCTFGRTVLRVSIKIINFLIKTVKFTNKVFSVYRIKTI